MHFFRFMVFAFCCVIEIQSVSAQEVVSATAREIKNAYATNETGAKARFENGPVRVTGDVEYVGESETNGWTVAFTMGDGLNWFFVYLEPSSALDTVAKAFGRLTIVCDNMTGDFTMVKCDQGRLP